MKKYLKQLLIVAILSVPATAGAQFYQIANQIPNMLSPALSGSLNYKGYVEASYLAGLGSDKVSFAGLSTSQGFKYRNWFFMGVGLGVDVAMGNAGETYYYPPNSGYEKTGVMVPVFTDFRFNIGNQAKSSFYADVKLGASFLMGNNYLLVGDSYLTNREYFYLRPSVGVRIPLKSNSGKMAVNVGVTYQLLTANYYSRGSSTVNALGGTIGLEW